MVFLLLLGRERASVSPAGSVRVGSDSHSGCHSLPTRSNPSSKLRKTKHRRPYGLLCFVWRRERDSNPRVR